MPPSYARLQERPFTTARTATLPAGAVRAEGGARLTVDRHIPLSGLSGDLLEVEAGVAVGLAGRIEGRLQGVLWQRMEVDRIDPGAPLGGELDLDGETAQDAGDFTLAARVRLSEAADASLSSAVQVGVRLPIAGNESGLGRDVTDVSAALLLGTRRGSLQLAGEAAFAILGNPTRAAAQNDQGHLGLLAELQPRGSRWALGLEGRTAFGDEAPGNEIVPELVAGARLRLASFWVDLAYRRMWVEGRAAEGLQVGISRELRSPRSRDAALRDEAERADRGGRGVPRASRVPETRAGRGSS